MRLVGLAFACICLAALAGCAPTPPSTALVKDDPFRPFREIETDVFRVGTQPGVLALKLVAQVDRKTGTTAILLKIHHTYTARTRHNYESARNIRAEPLKFIAVARHGGCRQNDACPLEEIYMIEIPEADLRASLAKGYQLKVFPRTGPDIVITIPTEMIQSLSTLLERERKAGSAPPKAG